MWGKKNNNEKNNEVDLCSLVLLNLSLLLSAAVPFLGPAMSKTED